MPPGGRPDSMSVGTAYPVATTRCGFWGISTVPLSALNCRVSPEVSWPAAPQPATDTVSANAAAATLALTRREDLSSVIGFVVIGFVLELRWGGESGSEKQAVARPPQPRGWSCPWPW